MADTCILGPDGQPVSSLQYDYGRGYGSNRWQFIEGANAGGGDRPYWPTRLDSINRLLPAYEHRILCAISEKIVANDGMINAALWSKARYSIGRAWLPRFAGENKEWGKLAAEWIVEQYYPLCDVRGARHDFQTNLEIDSVVVDRGGDFGILYTKFDTGFPAEQRIPNWRIDTCGGNGMVDAVKATKLPDGTKIGDGTVVVETPLLVPLRINNGVISNAIGRPLYYRTRTDIGDGVFGFDSTDYVDVHASDFDLIYDPEFYEQTRGIPALYPCVNQMRDAMTAHAFEQLAHMANSAITLIETNETGRSEQNDLIPPPPGGIPPGAEQTAQSMFGGLYKYLKAGSGGKLEAFSSSRPGDSWDSFQDRIRRTGIKTIGWSYMLAWGSDNPGGQVARGDLDQCRATVCDRQDLFRRPAARRLGRAVSVAINLGYLPPYPGKDKGGFLKWDFTMPGEITIDANNDRKNDREDFKMGIRNHGRILASNGDGDYAKFIEERADETALRKLAAWKRSQQPDMLAAGLKVDDRDMLMLTANEQPDGEDGAGHTKLDPETGKPATPAKPDPEK